MGRGIMGGSHSRRNHGRRDRGGSGGLWEAPEGSGSLREALGTSKNNEQGQRDKSKWNNYLKPFFVDVDYTDLELVEDMVKSDLELAEEELI